MVHRFELIIENLIRIKNEINQHSGDHPAEGGIFRLFQYCYEEKILKDLITEIQEDIRKKTYESKQIINFIFKKIIQSLFDDQGSLKKPKMEMVKWCDFPFKS